MKMSLSQAGQRKIKAVELSSLHSQSQQGTSALTAAQSRDVTAEPLQSSLTPGCVLCPWDLMWACHLHIIAKLPCAFSEVSRDQDSQCRAAEPHLLQCQGCFSGYPENQTKSTLPEHLLNPLRRPSATCCKRWHHLCSPLSTPRGSLVLHMPDVQPGALHETSWCQSESWGQSSEEDL